MKFINIQSNDLQVSLLEYGARLCRVQYKQVDVALGYLNARDYLNDNYYMGGSVGPIANRIAGAQLSIHGEAFSLPKNEGPNCLHSGGRGVDRLHWALITHEPDQAVFTLNYDLRQIGIRGNLSLLATYTARDSTLSVDYTGQCDSDTFINLTNHVYLNLSGARPTSASHLVKGPSNHLTDPLSEHRFHLMGHRMLLTNEQSIPTGQAVDFTEPLMYKLNDSSALNGQFTTGVDHHIEVKDNDRAFTSMMRAQSQKTGIGVHVSSNSPGYQFYTGRFLGAPFAPSMGFCVETQYAPNAINDPSLYSPLLMANETRTQTTTFEFTTA